MSSDASVCCRPGFLNLPFEIRNEIYKIVLQPGLNSNSEPPGGSCICDERVSPGAHERLMRNHFPSMCFRRVPSKPPETGDDQPKRLSMSILLVNKQIYQEAAKCLYNGPVSLDCAQSCLGAHVAFVNHADSHFVLPRIVLNRFARIHLRLVTNNVSRLRDGYIHYTYRPCLPELRLRETFLLFRFLSKLDARTTALRLLHIEYWFKSIDLQRHVGHKQQLADLISTHLEIYHASVRLGPKVKFSSSVHICPFRSHYDKDLLKGMNVVKDFFKQVEHVLQGPWGEREAKEDREDRFRRREEARLRLIEEDRGPIEKRICERCHLVTWTQADYKASCPCIDDKSQSPDPPDYSPRIWNDLIDLAQANKKSGPRNN
ncbi:MAG: hypothetical protein Q9160_002155 [Pyrenula sp. 1 TL-2023]